MFDFLFYADKQQNVQRTKSSSSTIRNFSQESKICDKSMPISSVTPLNCLESKWLRNCERNLLVNNCKQYDSIITLEGNNTWKHGEEINNDTIYLSSNKLSNLDNITLMCGSNTGITPEKQYLGTMNTKIHSISNTKKLVKRSKIKDNYPIQMYKSQALYLGKKLKPQKEDEPILQDLCFMKSRGETLRSQLLLEDASRQLPIEEYPLDMKIQRNEQLSLKFFLM